MQRSLLVLSVCHVVITLFGLTGCVLSGLNFGRTFPFPKNGEPIMKPEQPPGYIRSNYTHRIEQYKMWSTYYQLVAARASFTQEPSSFVMIPFLATTVLAAAMAVAAILMEDAYSTSTMLNCNVALWLIHLSYLINFLKFRLPYGVHELLLDNWKSGVPAVVVFHSIMLVLLTTAVVLCGWYLRITGTTWLSCNCLHLFTIGTVFTIYLMVLCTIALPTRSRALGKGLYPMYNNYTVPCSRHYNCEMHAVPGIFYFFVSGSMCVCVAVAVENFLSTVWGKGLQKLKIIKAVTCGVLNFITASMLTPSCLLLNYKGKLTHGNYALNFAISCCYLVHGWMLWCCPKFLDSPPSVISLMCLKTDSADDEEEEEEYSTSAVTSMSSINEENQEIVTNRRPSQIISIKNKAKLIARGCCLFVNSVLVVVALAILISLGVSTEINSNLKLTDLLLMATASQMMAKALVPINTVVFTGSPPVTTDLQHILHLTIESLILLTTSVSTLAATNDAMKKIAATLTLLAVAVKVLAAYSASPIQRALLTLASRTERTDGLIAASDDVTENRPTAAGVSSEPVVTETEQNDVFSVS